MNIPKRIYLQITGNDGEPLDPSERTHCEDRVHEDDIEYILITPNLLEAIKASKGKLA